MNNEVVNMTLEGVGAIPTSHHSEWTLYISVGVRVITTNLCTINKHLRDASGPGNCNVRPLILCHVMSTRDLIASVDPILNGVVLQVNHRRLSQSGTLSSSVEEILDTRLRVGRRTQPHFNGEVRSTKLSHIRQFVRQSSMSLEVQ